MILTRNDFECVKKWITQLLILNILYKFKKKMTDSNLIRNTPKKEYSLARFVMFFLFVILLFFENQYSFWSTSSLNILTKYK